MRQQLNIDTARQQEEENFYAAYDWCLNPVQKLRDLFVHLMEEFDRSGRVSAEWQKEECAINIYLLACAIGCIVDDYLVWRPWNFTPIGTAVPGLRLPVMLLQALANVPYLLASSKRRRSVERWRREYTAFIEDSCRLVLGRGGRGDVEMASLKNMLARLSSFPLPGDLLNRRMRINEGYRCQDLTHHDVLALTDRFLGSGPGSQTPLVVIGPRTAGAYFAPLIKVYLEQRGFSHVSWMTIRPKLKTTRKEYHHLGRLVTDKSHFILTDDYSNTGVTFRLVQNALRRHGVKPERITIFAPMHPTRPDIVLASDPGTKVFELRHQDLFKEAFLSPRSAEALFREYLAVPGSGAVVLPDDREVEHLNRMLWDHYRDGFQVRLKRVYRVGVGRDNPVQIKILGKSVGWGWLGYHAYLAAVRLRGFVPEVLCLRNGILFMEWIEGQGGRRSDDAGCDVENSGGYIVRRAQRLRFPEDPRFGGPDIGWGWQEILSILHRAYGSYPGYLKHNALLHYLKPHVSPLPTLIDGHMGPWEWIPTGRGMVKVDFEHHNFGAPELDIVDPAYDLAAVIFEFHLSLAEEEALVGAYREKTGDTGIVDRLILYKLLYGHTAKRKALERLRADHAGQPPQDWNKRYQWSWNFLVFTLTRFFSSQLHQTGPGNPAGRLMFLDLDGVLDAGYFGFPHTTPTGIRALQLLMSNGFTVVPNTGRSILHVRNYCTYYGFTAGIAEYGSVIFDACRQTEIPLISGEVERELEICRNVLGSMPDVFLDGDYRFSVRAYRYSAQNTVGLEREESEDILRTHHLTALSVIRRPEDTYFIGNEAGKGNGMKQFRRMFPHNAGPMTAVGDSDEDVSMLETAEESFAPSNCTQGVRKLAKKNTCQIISQPRQRGLFEIARLLTNQRLSPIPSDSSHTDEASFGHLLTTLTTRAEQPRIRKIVSLLRPNSL